MLVKIFYLFKKFGSFLSLASSICIIVMLSHSFFLCLYTFIFFFPFFLYNVLKLPFCWRHYILVIFCLMACLQFSSHHSFFGDLSYNWTVSFADSIIAVTILSHSSLLACWLLHFSIYFILMFHNLKSFIGSCRFAYSIFLIVRVFFLYIANNFSLIITVWSKWPESILGPFMDLIFWITSFY